MIWRELMSEIQRILSQRQDLVASLLIEPESRQIFERAYEKAVGHRWSALNARAEKVPAEVKRFALQYAEARAQGQSLQHITGLQAFLDHDYEVSPDVLIPRPETEVLVREAQRMLKGASGAIKGIEIGLGSGAISLELLSSKGELVMYATELKSEAAAIARQNAQRILGSVHAKRLKVIPVSEPQVVLEGLEPLLPSDQSFDFLISNPPYLAPGDPIDSEVDRNEPKEALYAPAGDPVFFYREIAQNARSWLKPSGWVAVEIPDFRSKEIEEEFRKSGWKVKIENDLTDRPRVLIAR